MRFRKIAAVLLTLALGFCLCQPAAFAATAADQHTQLQELPVSIQSTGETPLPKETLTVELEAVDNAPLPEVTTLEITAPVSTPAAPTMKPCTICAFPWCGTTTSWWPGWPCTHRPT